MHSAGLDGDGLGGWSYFLFFFFFFILRAFQADLVPAVYLSWRRGSFLLFSSSSFFLRRFKPIFCQRFFFFCQRVLFFFFYFFFLVRIATRQAVTLIPNSELEYVGGIKKPGLE